MLRASGSIDLAIGCYEEKGNFELPSLGRVQTKAYRRGKERAPIADELSRNRLDQALGTAGIRRRPYGARGTQEKLTPEQRDEIAKKTIRAWLDKVPLLERLFDV